MSFIGSKIEASLKDTMIKSFLGLVLTILLFLSSLGFVTYQLQNPDFITAQARKVNLYGRLTDNIKPLLNQQGGLNDLPLTSEDLNDVVKKSVDGETFYDFSHQYLTAYLDFLTGKNNALDFSYSLGVVKDKATTELATKLSAKYNDLPECQTTQLRTWSFAEKMPSCKLTGSSAKTIDVDRQTGLIAAKAISGLPENITANDSKGSLVKTRSIAMRAVRIINGLWIATGLLVLLMLLIWRRRSFFSLASVFLLVGIIEIGFSLVAWDWLAKNATDLLINKDMKDLAPLISDFIGAAMEVLKTLLGNISIVYLTLGGLLIIFGFVFRPKNPILVK